MDTIIQNFKNTVSHPKRKDCKTPDTHFINEVCTCEDSSWKTEKEYISAVTTFFKKNEYVHSGLPKKLFDFWFSLEKLPLFSNLENLKKCQLVRGALEYQLIPSELYGFLQTKKKLANMLKEFIILELYSLDGAIYWNENSEIIESGIWKCEKCEKEHRFAKHIEYKSSCEDNFCCSERVCRDGDCV